jgi:hypothetical protein
MEYEESLIIADSLLKRVRCLRRTTVHALPGADIDRLIDEITANKIPVATQRLILVHVATNNLESNTPDEICNKMAVLFDTIRARNKYCHIVFSGIIIRPRDEVVDIVRSKEEKPTLASKRRDANTLIGQMLSAKGGVQLETWRCLMVNHVANKHMYAKDKLHLNGLGINRISRYLTKNIARILGKSTN